MPSPPRNTVPGTCKPAALVRVRTQLREDAVIGIVFTTFFAVGLLIVSINPTSVDVQSIVLGNGSTELLDVVARIFLGPGDEAIIQPSKTGSGTLAFALAPEDVVAFDGRGIRPLPPGRVQDNGSYAPDVDALITGALALTWAHRDRLTQTSPVIVDHTGASIGPEPGVSYSIEVRWVDPDTGAAILPAGIVIDAGTATSWSLAPEAIPELGAPDRTSEIELAVRSRRLVEGSWITDREARWFRLTAPFAAGWDRGWGFLWGT